VRGGAGRLHLQRGVLTALQHLWLQRRVPVRAGDLHLHLRVPGDLMRQSLPVLRDVVRQVAHPRGRGGRDVHVIRRRDSRDLRKRDLQREAVNFGPEKGRVDARRGRGRRGWCAQAPVGDGRSFV